ncbi:MAG: ribonuclease Z [Flammeovirgaceae bacterium]|nr:ribonuclease Z [Flammeovirgaceae bacterium]
MHFEVKILGSGSATPAWGRHLSSQIINIEHQYLMIDCGEATQFRMIEERIKVRKLNHIFISHLHGDHYFGIFGLLSTFNLNGRKNDLHIYGPRGLDEVIVTNLRVSNSVLGYKLIFHEINIQENEKTQVLLENNIFKVTAILLCHRITCFGFLFTAQSKSLKVKADKFPKGLPFELIREIKLGNDVNWEGKEFLSNEYTYSKQEKKVYAYCTDTIVQKEIIPIIKGADLLYHEATFMEDNEDRAKATFHSTAAQAGRFASNAEVKKLIIGHFSSRYKELDLLLNEAKEHFETTDLALEGRSFMI